MNKNVAVLIPCYNEEATIKKVVTDFREALPNAKIYVYDNNSTDKTVDEALAAGAEIGYELQQGKGYVVRRMFREVDADIYILVDGDDTYPADHAHELMQPVVSGKSHMAVGTRLEDYKSDSFRGFHKIGNKLICSTINLLFDADLKDVLSGYRCFDSFFVKNIPLLSSGFEIETELTLQSLDKGFAVTEIPVTYGSRPEGSQSKLNTYSDGFLVFKTIFWIFKDYKPLKFFSYFALVTLIIAFGLGSIPILEFIQTGLVLHLPTALLATGLALVSLLSFATGFILDTLNRRQKEQYYMLLNLYENKKRN